MAPQGHTSAIVKAKLEEFFWEWLCIPESQKIVQQAIKASRSDVDLGDVPSPNFSPSSPHPGRTHHTSRPSPPGSPASRHPDRINSDSGLSDGSGVLSPSSTGSLYLGSDRSSVLSERERPSPASLAAKLAEVEPLAAQEAEVGDRQDEDPDGRHRPVGPAMLASGSRTIPRFWWPPLNSPSEVLPVEAKRKMHDYFVEHRITEIRRHEQLEPIVTRIFGLSKYFVIPIFHKILVAFDMVDEADKSKTNLGAESKKPITESMLTSWCQGRIQPNDPVLTFFWVVKKEHNNWIEREDFSIFLTAILLTHPGLDFLRETSEFQDRYADTVISRIFFVYDKKDVGRIYLSDLRRHKPSVIETWKQLAENDDMKLVRDYFSYEHFYVIYCTFWELDSDHDFLLDKDDLLKFDGHALSRRAIDRIFSEIPAKFTSAVPGKMGYEDFIRFLLCDQDRQSDRSVEYWFSFFDLDGDGCIRDHELKYFYEEQLQRMECLNYETITFADIMCQMNDMIFPTVEGQYRLSDFKRKRRFAGTFFSVFSSLSKFLKFEHRDPFTARQEQLDSPHLREWDRWCASEYLRLAMEDDNEPEEDMEVSRGNSVDELSTCWRRLDGD